uniref:uncharacterized protein LOC106995412 isoform X2 n=1 Tax=Macaca mulatta TaxID=9544 RepID=UPI0010A214D9|nr:uncharacterized protein LOC106995412 isoform X2 [Macaca mulatta]
MELQRGGDREPFEWRTLQQQAFHKLKEKLMLAPALGLPDLTKLFTLYVSEREKMAVGVLTQTVGPWPRPVAYLSKQLDGVSKGWSPCLRALAATALLAQEADKLTLGQNLNIKAPHAVATLMNTRGHHWLTNARLTKYQGLLRENSHITIEVCNTLNPVTLLPVSDSPIEHNCVEVLDSVYSSQPDLRDQPWASVDWELYVDGSSFIDSQGERCAGYAVLTLDDVVEAKPLPQGTSAQKAELIGLTRALELSEVAQRCVTCRQHSAKQGPSVPPGIQAYGAAPFEDLQVDFTEMPKCRGNKYLLVLVCTYSGWVEAYPT